MPRQKLHIGYVPLIDCAIPVVARELGFAEAEGLELVLGREHSWASIRDKLAVGLYEAAHLLAGIPLAARLGLGGMPQQNLIVPMALGRGGNAITVSLRLYQRMLEASPDIMAGPRGKSAKALKNVIEQDRSTGRPPLSFATVFPFSSHNYELRHWLSEGGIDPYQDVNIGIIAPPRMFDSLRNGWIDGYCVGEPWNQRAVDRGDGIIVALKEDIHPDSPEKVLGIREDWASRNQETLKALLRALDRAAAWADAPENRGELAQLLSDENYVGAPFDILHASLSGRPVLKPGETAIVFPDRHVFFRQAATVPSSGQAAWLIHQMQRWNQAPSDLDLPGIIQQVYRPDLYRDAIPAAV